MPIVALPPSPPPHQHDRDFAIVVGIDHYGYGIPALSGAINDCKLFCRWLTTPGMGGLNPANVTYFRSRAPERDDPIRSHIEKRLRKFYLDAQSNRLPLGRRLYLFFAGHGLISPTSQRTGCALVMADAEPDALRGLLGFIAADAMRTTGFFEEVMLVMDCCSEVAGPSELACLLPNYGDPTQPARPYTHIQAAPWGAATAERMLDNPFGGRPRQLYQGVLTNALLRGLMSAADLTGSVTSSSLKQFIESTQSGPTVEFGTGPEGQQMIFGTPQGLAVNVSLANGATRFQVREGGNFTVVVPPSGPRTVRLAAGQYLFDALDPTGIVTRSQAISVRQGGLDVTL